MRRGFLDAARAAPQPQGSQMWLARIAGTSQLQLTHVPAAKRSISPPSPGRSKARPSDGQNRFATLDPDPLQ